MKHDYYADEKDAAKWTVAFAERGLEREGVVQVAMMPNLPIPAPPYHFDPMPGGTSPAVAQFFQGERLLLLQGATPRDAARIVGLAPSIVYLNPLPYLWAQRAQYFAAVENHLLQREARQRDVVLLDPCTGLSSFSQGPGDTHLDSADITTVWGALRQGDVLMVFQYQLQGQYAGNWQHLARGLLAGTLGLPLVGVRNCGLNGAVRFFCATKP